MTRQTKKTLSVIAVLILIIIAIVALIPKKNIPNDQIDTTATSTDVVINDTNAFYTISATYPTEPRDTKNVMSNTITDIVKQKQQEWKVGGDVYNDEQQLAKQFPDRPAMQYELDIVYNASTSAAYDTHSYVFKNYEFTGGAHGNTGLSTYTFGPNGQIMIEDILNLADNNNDLALTKLVEAKLKDSLGDNLNMDMLDEGLGLAYIKPDGSFDSAKCGCDGFLLPSNFQNFVVTDEGIKFIFGQYQVAPYVNGMPEVLVSWDELKPYVNKGFTIK